MRITFWGVRRLDRHVGSVVFTVRWQHHLPRGRSRWAASDLRCRTGVRGLGQKLMREAATLGQPVTATMLFAHLHWDHVQGFPFFGPAFHPDADLALYGPIDDDGHSTLKDVLRRQMGPPSFPVTLDQMPATKQFHTIGDGSEHVLNGMLVRTRALNHPQGSLGARIERGGRVMCFATDTEHPADGSLDPALLDLARGADILVYDAQYTEAEFEGRSGTGPCRRGWGHSTYVAAARIARAAGAKRLVLTHHDPGHDDTMMERIEREARALFPACRAARESMPIAV